MPGSLSIFEGYKSHISHNIAIHNELSRTKLLHKAVDLIWDASFISTDSALFKDILMKESIIEFTNAFSK